MKLQNRTKGVLCILCSALCFGSMSAFVRLAGELPVFEKAFFRNFVAAIIVFFIVRGKHIPLHIEKKDRLDVLLRCIFGTAGVVLNFYAIDRLDLADSNMLNKLSPFFAILFSRFILKEKIRPVQAIAVVGAFIGALLIIKPTGSNLAVLPAIGGFFGGMGAGAAYTFVRKATGRGVRSELIVLCFSCFSCLFCLPFITVNFVMPTLRQTILLLLCGACGAGGQFAITTAYRFAPAKEISIYDYVQVIISTVYGYFLFDQLPDRYSFLGYFIIIVMAVVNFLYNSRARHNGESA